MKELVETILVYIVIVSVLQTLISNPKYGQYFRFFSGIILILIMLSPLLRFFQCEDKWYHLLEENILQMDLDEMNSQLERADEGFHQMVLEKYKMTVENQVERLAQENGIELSEVTVTLKEGKDGIGICQISGRTDGMEHAEKREKENSEIAIETIRVGQEKGEKKKNGREDTSGKAKKLKEQIRSFYAMGEDRVYLWK